MKSIVKIAVAAMVLVAASCSKEGAKRFEGNWSYKTSGTVVLTLAEADTLSTDIALLKDTMTVSLPSEAGQMNIVKSGDDGGMMVTMNAIGGGVTVFDAVADGERLVLVPLTRRVKVKVADALSVEADVEVSGYGERYDDVMVFRLVYEGVCAVGDRTYDLVSENVDCVAELNG